MANWSEARLFRHSGAILNGRSWALAVHTQFALNRQYPWGALLVMAAILIATCGLTTVKLINDGAAARWQAGSLQWLAGRYSVEARSADTPLTRNDYAALRRAGFSELVATVRYTGPFTQQTNTANQDTHSKTAEPHHQDTHNKAAALPSLQLLAVDTTALPMAQSQALNASVTTATAQVWATPSTAAELGDRTLLTSDGSRLPAVQSADTELPDNLLLMDISHFYRTTRTIKRYPLSALLITQDLSAARQQALRAELPAHLTLVSHQDPVASGTIGDSFQLNLWAMGALMAVVSLFIVVNALHLMLRRRLPTLIRLRQLGFHTRTLLLTLAAEMALLGILASTAGVLAGIRLTEYLSPGLSKTFANLFEMDFSFLPPRLWQLLIPAWLLSALAVNLVALIPVRQLRERLNGQTEKHLSNQVILALFMMLLAATAVSVLIARSQSMAFVSIALVLLCGAACVLLSLPWLMRLLSQHIPARWVVIHWVVASARQLARRTQLAVGAFFIALAANIGMNVMVDSFRQATESWLQQRLVADAYISTQQSLNSPPPPGVTLFPGYYQQGRVQGQPLSLRSLPDHPVFRASMSRDVTGETLWPRFYAGKGIFINQQLAFQQGLSTGDDIAIQINAAQPLNSEVLGIYRDYGNPDRQVLLPANLLAPASQPVTRYAVLLSDGASQQSLQQWLQDAAPEARLYDAAALQSLSMAEFERTFVITDSLNAVTLAVAGLSFLISIALISLDMRPQLSLLRALGVHAFSVRLALLGQYLLLCSGTALLALPFGVLLSWLLINKVNRYAFYWSYPLQTDPAILTQSALISVGAILILLSLPLARLQPRLDLRNEKAL